MRTSLLRALVYQKIPLSNAGLHTLLAEFSDELQPRR
ncbi:MAG: hypothetical protein ACI9K2_005692, partial [Myxococcota bacterium]